MWVKICGTTTEEDALLAVAMGADAIGFIFAPSKRQVAPSHVADIIKRLPPEILTVGVFRDEAPQRVVDIVTKTGLRAAQLSGHETPEQVKWVRSRLPFVIKAFSVTDPRLAEARECGADVVMLDAETPGSGQVFDWALADAVPPGIPVLLAGGLTPENVAQAIEQVQPWGVDVASGVESSPGHKDARRLRAFIRAAKETKTPRSEYQPSLKEPYDWQADE